MNGFMKIGMASALAIATALPAYAQQYRPTPEYQRQLERYEDQRERYDERRERYEDTRADYRESRREYRQARRDYERRLAEWDRARSIYDRRYGRGAYARLYARPVWDERYWTRYESPPYAGYYGANASANWPTVTSVMKPRRPWLMPTSGTWWRTRSRAAARPTAL